MLSCPCGTTERPLVMAKICRPKTSLDWQTTDMREVDRQALGPLGREVHAGGDPVEVERLQECGQVHPPVEPLERLLELDVLGTVVMHVAADRVELLEPAINDRPDVGPEQSA